MKTRLWYLPVIAVNLVTATAAVVATTVRAPQLLWRFTWIYAAVFLLCSAASCFVANAVAENGRAKALWGMMFGCMGGGMMVGPNVHVLYGTWAGLAATAGPMLLLALVVLIWRNWFRAGGSSDGTERSTAE